MNKRSLIFVLLLAAAMFFVNQWMGEKQAPQAPQKTPSVEEETTPSEAFTPTPETTAKEEKQKYYVLENGFQQLVFSSIGGAITEINLPLQSKDTPTNVIRPIHFDQVMEMDHPLNDHFPSVEHYIPSSDPTNPTLQSKGTVGGYTPLIRRSIVGPTGTITHALEPKYYAFNLISDDSSIAKLPYSLKRIEKNLIEFEATQPQRRITKTFSFPKDPANAPYCIDLKIKVEGDARGLSLTSGIPEVELISGNPSPLLKYRTFKQQKAILEKISLPKTSVSLTSVLPDWISNSNGFFGIILDPLSDVGSGFSAEKVSGELGPSRLTLIDAKYDLYPASKYPGYNMYIPLLNSGKTSHFRIFAGPYDHSILATVDQTYTTTTGATPGYSSVQSFDRWFSFISEPFSKFLFMCIQLFYRFTHSWGISIVLLTVLLRLMLYPLNAWSIKSMAKMQAIAPKVAAVQEKYKKKDPKRAQLEVMNLYRENKVNPLTGCFPMLIQLPFLIGMFDLLRSSFDLRGASFIPGWIDNLAAPDVVFTWNYPIFFIGTSLHLLPILLGIVMYIQQKLSSTATKNTQTLTDQQRQQKTMGNVMVIVFSVLFYHFPSGLNIYWLSSMLLGILQQWYTTKKVLSQPEVIK
jgi:YidC/Oxa1 family membrane protein insertase